MNKLPFGEVERKRLEEWSQEYDMSKRTAAKSEAANILLLLK